MTVFDSAEERGSRHRRVTHPGRIREEKGDLGLPVLSFVVIGLNEAPRLGGSICALYSQGFSPKEIEVVYVDSGSSDDSPEIAAQAGVDRVLTIPRATANAARARNTGLEVVRAPLVHFVDGDTHLETGWARAALRVLQMDECLAGVEGRLREARPRENLYHAVCGLDWPTAPGTVPFLGGNAMYRVAALREVAGFNPLLSVGEDPELGVRLRAAGWRLLRLEADMGQHDLDVKSMSDYLRRAYSSGLSCALVCSATGGLRRGFWHERIWRTLAYAATLVGSFLLGVLLLSFFPTLAAVILGVSVLALLLLAARKAFDVARGGCPAGLALAYGLHCYLFRISSATGMIAGLSLKRYRLLNSRGAPTIPTAVLGSREGEMR